MAELTPTQQLDTVLKWLTNNELKYRSVDDTRIDMGSPTEISTALMELILNRLLKDENVLVFYAASGTHKTGAQFILSFDGKVKWDLGGYTKEKELNDIEISKNEAAKIASKGLQNTLLDYQKWIVVATAVAGIYYLKEVLVFLYRHTCLFH